MSLSTFHTVCAPPCDEEQMLVPQPGRIRRWLQRGQHRPINPGLFIPIWWDLRLRTGAAPTYEEDETGLLQHHVRDQPEAEEDAIDLMQRPVPSQSPSLRPIRLIGLHRMFGQVTIDADLSIFDQVQLHWPFTQRDSSDVKALHEVTDPPNYANDPGASMFIIEFNDDYFHQVHVDDVLILVTVIQETPVRKQRLKALWAPCKMTRAGALDYVRLAWFCRQPDAICHVYLNNVYWNFEDSSIKTVVAGDHLQVRIRSTSYGWCDYEHSETIARERRLFVSSDEEDPQASNSGDQRTAQSPSSHTRSRSRDREPGDESADSLSLIQQRVRVILSTVTVQQDATDLTRANVNLTVDCPGGKPHVNDRWCAQPSDSPHELGKVTGYQQITNSPVPLSLVDTIAPPCWIRVNYSQVSDLRDRLLAFQIGPVDPSIAKVVKWHEATLAAFERTPSWTDEPALEYRFFTDGSSYRCTTTDGLRYRIGASAVVLIVSTPAGERYGGSMAFNISDDPTAPQTEIAAVTTALLWTMNLAHNHPHHSHPFRATLGFDCVTAGRAAEGRWKILNNVDSQTTNRALTQWLQQQLGVDAVKWEHIPSHQGHAWNEAADAIAWAAVHQWIEAADFGPIQALFPPCDEDLHVASWLWFLEASLQGSPQVPPNDGQNFLVDIEAPLAHRADPEAQPLSIRCTTDAPEGPRQDFDFTLRCATANVLTLYGHEDGKGVYISARQEALIKQMAQMKVHIAGIQETRSAAEGHTKAEGYHILSASASAKGVGGVQIWVAQKWIFDGFNIDVSAHHLRIVHHTTQRLIVVLEHPGLKIVLTAAHAPACDSVDNTRRFWQMTDAALPKRYRDWPIIYLLDANARVGSITTSSIGSHGGEEENEAGASFHEWMLHNDYTWPRRHSATTTRAQVKRGSTQEELKHVWIT